MSKQDIEKLLQEFNSTETDFPRDKTIIECFEEVADNYPSNISVVHKENKISYKKLNDYANRLGWLLKRYGVSTEQIVGIFLQPGIDMITSILGVLKTGAAYMPMASEYPEDRLVYMLNDSNSKIMITSKDLLPEKDKDKFGVEVLYVEDFKSYDKHYTNLDRSAEPHNLAYVIYTSGSTGKPKGVMIENRSLINLCSWHIREFSVTPEDNCTKYAGVAFDASVWEIFPPLFAGASLHIISKDIKLDVEKLNTYYNDNNITVSFLPTQFAEMFMAADNNSLKTMLIGGDKLKQYTPKKYSVINAYGPTEATILATTFKVDKFYDNIPIGKPASNYKVYVIDKDKKLCPISTPGELCISGVALARGYLNRTELSAEKFIDNPYASKDEKKNGYDRLYKTGDLAQWLPDGNVEFLGRIDFQVKIRGFRVELGEIEAKLTAISAIEDAAVLAHDDPFGNKYLCGYYVSKKDLKKEDIKIKLAKNMPDYMVPNVYVPMREFPITPNGKIDRKALPIPDLSEEIVKNYVAPKNEKEKNIAEVWGEVLGVEKVGTKDNFFDIGGNSLKGVSISAKLQMHYEVKIEDLFSYPTVGLLAKKIVEKDVILDEIKPITKKEFYRASGSQSGMFLTDKLGDLGTAYNIPMLIGIKGDINREKFGIAIDKLVERHEALRTSFNIIDDNIVQIVHDNISYKKEFAKVSEEELQGEAKECIKPFDLTEAPLFRIKLFKIEKTKHVLFFDLHHIIFDGGSVDVFIKDLFALYRGEELIPIDIHYKEFAEWEAGYKKTKEYQDKQLYWLSRFSDSIPQLELTTDFPRKKEWDYRGNTLSTEINSDIVTKIKEIEKKYKATAYSIMIAVYNILLLKYTRQNDIVIGAAVSGRTRPETQDVIGMFVNTLPLRNTIDSTTSLKEIIQVVQHNVLELLSNQDYSFSELVNDLGVKADIGRNPVYDVVFNYLVKDDRDNINISFPVPETSMFDINLTVTDSDDGMTLDIEYKKCLFEESTMKRFMEHYINLLERTISNPEEVINNIDILSEDEHDILLNQFNDTGTEWPKDKTLVELFEESVVDHSDNIAVVHKDRSITYADLNGKVNQLANILRSKGVEKESRVGIYLGRDIEIVISMLAVLKSGGCYVPIDSKYPKDRIEYMLEDSNAVQLISTKELVEKLGYEGDYLDIYDPEMFSNENTPNPSHVNKPSDLSCLIYTSGSTGKPKGAMLEHRNLVNFTCWYKEKRKIRENENFGVHSSFSFDATIMGTYPVLFSGATEHILPEEIRLSLKDIDAYFTDHNISGCFFTTQLGEQYMEDYDNDSLRFVEVGGEKLKKFIPRKYNFINGYGPTESTVYVTDFEVDKNYANIPIGKPLSNVKIYIVDKGMNPSPIGVPGELCISGNNLGRGYLHRPDLTAEKYIDNPFSTDQENLDGYDRMYKTGDLARWLPDGNIEVIGRIDFQVKIRGFRIELGEIETKIIENPLIDDAAVVALDDVSGNKYLCGYYISKKDLDKDDIRKDMLENLPDYMVPNIFVHMDKFPITPNGKVDRKALPIPDISKAMAEKYVAPSSDIEIQIADVWAKVLGLEKVGVKDNFFDLGGSSLKAVSVVSKLQKYLDISVADIFSFSTISDILANLNIVDNGLENKLEHIKSRMREAIEAGTAELDSLIEEKNIEYSARIKEYDNIDIHKRLNVSNVLLTGATGYLGVHVLKELLDSGYKKVYCIIRAKDNDSAVQRLHSKLDYYFGKSIISRYADNIQVIKGDLSEDNLGLDSDAYSELTENVDSIIHTAANVGHYGEYEIFYKSNVQPVINLVNLSKMGNKKNIHYISTRSVCDAADIPGQKYLLATDFDDMSDTPMMENVYVKTKLEGEKVAIEARKEGVNTSIYRVGNLVFNSETGKHQENLDDNGFYQTVKSYLNFGYVPDIIDEVEMSYINYTAKAICTLFDKENLQNEIFHVYNPNKPKLSELLTDKKLGLKIDAVSFGEFIDVIFEKYERKTFTKYIENYMLHSGLMDDELNKTEVCVFQEKTDTILSKLGFIWKPIDSISFINTIYEAFKSRIDWFSKQAVLADLSDEVIFKLSKMAKLQEIDKDKMLISAGSENRKIYFIMEGMLTESKKSFGGWESVLRILSDSSILGIRNFTGNYNAGSSFETILNNVTLLEIDIEDFTELAFSDKTFLKNLFEKQFDEKDKLKRMIIALG